MSLTVHLLGPPRADGASYELRSRKSWALLARLILGERPPSRSELAQLLYAQADDPLRALRWGLAELRRCLGVPLDGDPVVLRLPPGTVVDVDVLRRGSWTAAVELPGLGADLLDGIALRGAAAFDSWLLSERRLLAAAAEEILHEAALGRLAGGDLGAARAFAVRAVAMNPLDENHQALLIGLYRRAGDDRAAARQYAAVTELFHRELRSPPGSTIDRALRESRAPLPAEPADVASVGAIVEAGAAAMSAGAVEAGVRSLRTAIRLADQAGAGPLRLSARLTLAEALIHSIRGRDEEGLAALHEADRIAQEAGDPAAAAQARAEIGYVDFLRARYDRAERWLTSALESADGAPALAARATMYLGTVESDRAAYPRAVALLERAVDLASAAGDPRGAAYALSMLGRAHLLTGDLAAAAVHLDRALELASRDHWLAFLPWPQALRGELHLAAGDLGAAAGILQQAFARACQIGDPCWEGMAARALALVAEARGETARAFEVLADARLRSTRLADPYVWLDAHILDTQCALGRRHGHPDTPLWIDALRRLASRTGMRELTVRALLHSAAAGHPGDRDAAQMFAADLHNPVLDALLRAQP